MRIEAITAASELLATALFRGECQYTLITGLRHLSLDLVVYWLCPRSEQQEIRLFAVFFRGQDHQRRMLVRLLQNSAEG